MGKKGISLLEGHRRNRVFIKDTIFKMGLVSRAEIRKEIGLTLPTVTTAINEMIEERILEEVPLPEERQNGGIGRKPTGVRFRAGAACAIGVELGPHSTRIIAINLNGETLSVREEEAAGEDYQEMTEKLAEQILEVVKENQSENLLGVGIGLPGFIDRESGIIRSHRKADWVGKSLVSDMERRLGLPVLVDNNVRLRAVGYEMRTHKIQPDTFAYFYISKGIACPLMVKDDVLTGYTAGAGEVGHMVLYVGDEGRNHGRCVDDLAGEENILRRCRNAMEARQAEKLRKIVERAGKLEIEQVLEAQMEGDEAVCGILEEVLIYLGVTLANIVNLINPGFVVVEGYLMENPMNQKMLKRAAVENFFGLNEEEVRLLFKPFQPFWGAEGAAYFVIRRFFLEK